jgi:hypothetical protein
MPCLSIIDNWLNGWSNNYIISVSMLGLSDTQLVDMVNNSLFPTLYRQGAANLLLYRISPQIIYNWPGAVGTGPISFNFPNGRTLTMTKQPYWLKAMIARDSAESAAFMSFFQTAIPIGTSNHE